MENFKEDSSKKNPFDEPLLEKNLTEDELKPNRRRSVLSGKNSSNNSKINKERKKSSKIVKPDYPVEDVFGEMKVSFFTLFMMAGPLDIFLMIIGTIAGIGSGILMPLSNKFVGSMTDDIAPGESPDYMHQARKYARIYFVLGIIGLVLGYLGMACWMIAGENQSIKFRKEYFKALLRQEIAWFDMINPYELNSKVSNDTTAIQGALGEKFFSFFYISSLCISGFVIGFTSGWKLSLVISIGIVPGVVCGAFLGQSFYKMAEANNIVYEKSGGLAEQALNSVRTVYYLNGQKKENKNYGDSMEGSHKTIQYYGIMAGASFGGLFFFIFLSFAIGIWYSARLVRSDSSSFTGGDALTIIFSILSGTFSLGGLTPVVKAFSEGQKALGRMIPILLRVPKIDVENPNGIKKDKLDGVIEFKDVRFAYPSKPDLDVLNGIDFKINKGEKIALVGESGCGKTTVTFLLERFYDVKSGSVSFDGENIKDYNIAWLRHNIGYVGQEPVLFATSIMNNILFAKEGATKEEAIDAAKKANAYDFIMNLDKKFNTFVGSGGTQLSGGQKQRIAIARAILKNPNVLILDEATSALDRKNEAEIQRTLDEISVGRTTIVIAHRLSTIINSDRIFVFSKGNIIQVGSHDELINIDGKYQALQKHQVIEEKESDNEEDQEEEEEELKMQKILKRFSSKVLSDKSKSIHGSDLASSVTDKKAGEAYRNKLMSKYSDNEVYSRLINFMSDYKMLFIGIIFFGMSQGTIFPQFALYFPKMLELLSNPHKENFNHDRNIVIMEFLIIAVTAFISRLITNWFSNLYGAILAIRLRKAIYKKYLELHVGWHDDPDHNPGVLTAKLSTDVLLVNKLISDLFMILADTFTSLFLGILISMIVSWRVGIPLLLTAPVMVFVSQIQEKLSRGFSLQSENAYVGSAGFITEALTNMKTVVSFSREQELVKLYDQRLEEPKRVTIKKSNATGFMYGVSQFCTFCINAYAYYIGIYNIDKGHVNFKEMYTCLFGIIGGAFGAGTASQYMPDIGKANIAGREIMDILDDDVLVKNIDENNSHFISGDRDVQGEIEFRNVTFSYPSRPQKILNNFSLKIDAQTKVALVGPSGCGKSTIMQILLRFYNVESGEVFLDGVNIINYDIGYLRSLFGVVAQEPVLFSGTIEYNIKYNKEDATEGEMREAAASANALRFIESNQYEVNNEEAAKYGTGFQRMVGPKGGQLSGGQKQRIAIARAIIRKPPMLLLDEATSALDAESEKVVQEALDKLMDGKTSLTIAHRLTTIKDSDKIVVLDAGKIMEMGKFDELMKKKLFFYALAQGTG